MPQLLKAGLIRSLAATPQARPQAPRDARADDKFATELDTARNSIRESREAASSERSKARTEDDSKSESKPVDKRQDDRADSTSDQDTASAELAVAATPIVVVSIAPPVTPVADAATQSDCEQPPVDGDSTEAPVMGGIQNTSGQATIQSQSGSTNGEAGSPVTPEADSTGVVNPIKPDSDQKACGKGIQAQGPDDLAITNAVETTGESESAAAATRNEPTSQTKTASSQAQVEETADSPSVSRSAKPTTVQTANQQETAKSGDTPKDGETIRDVRIHDALERALAGGSQQQQQHGDGDDAHRGQRDHASAGARAAVHDKAVRANASRDATGLESPMQPTGVTETTGDVAAAAIGKFLVGLQPRSSATALPSRIDARGDVRSDSVLDQPATPSSAATTSTGVKVATAVATRESPTTTFSQILATRLDPSSALDGAARTLAASGGSGRHQVTLRLAPAELGDLRLDVRMDQGAMSLRVEADNAVAGKLIESRLGELRDALAAHGISVERAEVVVRSDASANGTFEHRSHSDDATPRHHPTNGETGDSGWNFNSGQSFSGGDRSGRPDANPWWSAGEATNVVDAAATTGLRTEERSWTGEVSDRSIDLVA